MRDMLMDAANQIGVKIIETDANDNAEKQNEDIETLIAQDVDGFLIAAGFEDAVNPGIEAAYATGKPVIIFDRFVSTQDYTASVFYSDITCGEIAAEILVDALKEKKGSTEGAKVIVLEALAGAGTTSQRNEGIMNIFEPAGIEIVASYACNFSKDEAKKNMEDALVRFDPGEIDGIISHNGEQTLGAWEAIVEAGREDEFRGLISNIDGCNGVARLIKEGIVAGLSQFPCRCSVDALELLVKMLNDPNMEVEKEVFLTPDKVTQDNIDEWYLPEVPDNGWTA